jgi:hypothetical protein
MSAYQMLVTQMKSAQNTFNKEESTQALLKWQKKVTYKNSWIFMLLYMLIHHKVCTNQGYSQQQVNLL